jgi:hypothetical protein
MRDERQVELRVASDHGSRREVLAAADAVRILQHLLCAPEQVALLQWPPGALGWLELVQEDRVVLAVRDVLGKVGDPELL